MKIANCPECQSEFTKRKKATRFCSRKCSNVFLGKQRRTVDWDNPVAIKEYWKKRKKEYYYSHQEKISSQGKEYYLDNKDKIKEYNKAQYWKDPQKHIKASVEYARNNPEVTKARQARYRKTHLEKLNADWHKRRALLKLAGSFTVQEWQNMLLMYNNRCVYCGSREKITKDHFVPISRGGFNTIENIVPACLSCNSKKKDNLWALNTELVST